MFKQIYAIPLVIILVFLSIATISAYTIKLPVCSDTVTTSCVNLNDATGTVNAGNPAIVFYQSGNLYISNDIPTNYSNVYHYNVTNVTYMNYTNMTYITYTNLTNITQNNISYITYHMNYSNGSTFVIQQNTTVINYSINNDYIRDLFQQVYIASNFSNFYNRSYIDANFETLGDINNVKAALSTYATRAELANYDARIAALNNLNSLNWSGFNMTRLNEISDGGGDFSMTWKVIIVIEGVVIILLLLLVVKNMMGGGDY